MSFDNRRRGSGRDNRRGERGGFDNDFEPYGRSSYGGDFGGARPYGDFGGRPAGGGGDFGNRGAGDFASRAGGGRFGGGAGGGGGGGNVIGTAQGTVKFFNAAKGFGFIVREDGGEDVFVHISAVERAGLEGLAEGQPLKFTLSERNGRVSAIDLQIEGEPLPITAGGGGGDARGRGPGAGAGGGGRPQVSDERYEGTVKFFNSTKGFGFIAREDGGPDAFVHISAVERAGLNSLSEGQRVSFQLEVDRRGKQAATNLSAS